MARITVNTDTNTLVAIEPTTDRETLRYEALFYATAAHMVAKSGVVPCVARRAADKTLAGWRD